MSPGCGFGHVLPAGEDQRFGCLAVVAGRPHHVAVSTVIAGNPAWRIDPARPWSFRSPDLIGGAHILYRWLSRWPIAEQKRAAAVLITNRRPNHVQVAESGPSIDEVRFLILKPPEG